MSLYTYQSYHQVSITALNAVDGVLRDFKK